MRAGNHIKTKHAAAMNATYTHTHTHTERLKPTQEGHQAGNPACVFNTHVHHFVGTPPDALQLDSVQQEIKNP